MAADRIAVIINEIKYWKEHRLLPETYCDFLLALYTKGEAVEEDDKQATSRIRWTPLGIIHICLSIAVIPFSFLVLYFTEFHTVLQLGILSLFWVYTVWLYFYFPKKGYDDVQLPLYVSLLMLLLITATSSTVLSTSNFFHTAIILSNFVLWFYVSIVKKYRILQFISVIFVIFTLSYFIFTNLTA
ncbi:hypothetical protein [Oceanobacillus damuensis]|uniref:hypothetical protein n=1 Tax=Oceanobacillus damuensis TaxID=937928 RepID=UPI0008329262|nr:hypothetical protein [Oceanobacillus damuensis]